MIEDPLLSDDLATLLREFPNEALRSIVGIVKKGTSWSPFPAPRAYDAHNLPETADLAPYVESITREIIWWGSNEIHRQMSIEPNWRNIVDSTAKWLKVPENARSKKLPAWKIEQAMILQVLSAWETMSPKQRENAILNADVNFSGVIGGAVAAIAGGIARLSETELMTFLTARATPSAVSATTFAPIVMPFALLLTVGSAFWGAYDLAGPGYRVLRPVALFIAFTRKRLRDERAADAFRD